MKFYNQSDLENSKKARSSALKQALLFALPFLVAAVAGFMLRIEWICALGVFLACASFIFLYDLRIKPAMHYAAHLAEIHSGLTRQTGGALVRIGCDPVYHDGVNFYEVILNIYEDLDEEGERRFLLDCSREMPAEWLNRDVIITSHGSFVLEARLAEAKA